MALIAPFLSLAGEVVIIANESVLTSTLASDDIKQIFLGKRSTWDNGAKIVIVVQDRTDASDLFFKTYIMKNAYQYDIYWKKQVFTGKGKAPKSFSSDQELVQFVSQTPGAIGYVSSDTDIGKAKIIPVR
jgi:ABC-type phosphate transport system substrate-binding protein